MPMMIACPDCEKALKVSESLEGKKIRCPNCKSLLLVPAAEEPDYVEAELEAEPTPTPKKKFVRRFEDDRFDDDDVADRVSLKLRKNRKRKSKQNQPNYLVWGLAGAGVLTFIIIGILVININGSEAELTANRSIPQGANTTNTRKIEQSSEPNLSASERKLYTIWNVSLSKAPLQDSSGGAALPIRFDYRLNDPKKMQTTVILVIAPPNREKIYFTTVLDSFNNKLKNQPSILGKMEIRLQLSTSSFGMRGLRDQVINPNNLIAEIGNNASVYLAILAKGADGKPLPFEQSEPISNIMPLQVY